MYIYRDDRVPYTVYTLSSGLTTTNPLIYIGGIPIIYILTYGSYSTWIDTSIDLHTFTSQVIFTSCPAPGMSHCVGWLVIP